MSQDQARTLKVGDQVTLCGEHGVITGVSRAAATVTWPDKSYDLIWFEGDSIRRDRLAVLKEAG